MQSIKENIKRLFSSRIFVFGLVMILMFSVVLGRVFYLQIICGQEYQENFTMLIEKTLPVNATRGNIYDCNGNLLAYNELAYSVTISDNTTYNTNSQKNYELNQVLSQVIEEVEANGESITNNFSIDFDEKTNSYSYNVEGSTLKRFLADVFGESSYDDLEYNKEFDFDESNATATQVMNYLMNNSKSGFFKLSSSYEAPDYSPKMAYEITVIRYAMLDNRYTKYNTTTIAENVGDTTVAYVKEHSDTLTGIDIEEDTIRKYNYSEYFASIIGYTGKITNDEYEEYHQQDDSYTLNDVVGRTGLEAYYESYLRGTNGQKKVYLDNVGRITEVISSEAPVAGNDLYLSIDADLQKATYLLLEQEIASIVYSKIKSGEIPIEDVYYALINNNVIDIDHFSSKSASSTETMVSMTFSDRQEDVLSQLKDQLTGTEPLINNDMEEAMLDYVTSMISMLKEEGILLSSEIDTDDTVYTDWRAGKISPQEYLQYCISMQWIDISKLDVEEQYADSNEIYNALVDLIIKKLKTDDDFSKNIYHYLITDNLVTGKQLCLILYDQGILDYDDEVVAQLVDGSLSAYTFLLDKINNIEITPAQLALDPCTGSCVITDTESGEIKALVSYPGYDNNRLANGVDADYFNALTNDLSNPLYNYATQERTAPGSTFKMVTSTAGLAEGVITKDTYISCEGQFMEVSNTPKCWIYPKNHGAINVSEALRDSCNYFFYTVGYNLACRSTGIYDDATGIGFIQKYAKIYGLDQTTGLEIEENKSKLATEYPVMAAIGQSDNNITTAALSRYVTAVTTGKLYNYQLMNKIVDADGNVVETYEPQYEDISDVLNTEQWNAIHYGMFLVCENLECFDDFAINVAGKTGTAQEGTKPNHALFVGYAPYEDPEVTIACRIANGYTSHNAAAASKNILSYYFGEESLDDLLSANAEGVAASSENSMTD